jgi:two-component system cell cycle response regulator
MAKISVELRPLRVLLVEDSKGDAILIKKALTQDVPDPHVIQHATTLASALKALAENEFDVVLLDRSLPDATGFNGLISIQNRAPKLPVIFLTGLKDEAIALSAVEKGAQDYLFKDNVDNRTIERAIHYAIRRKRFEEVLILQANFDNLTGLVNRILFENRLDITLTKIKRQEDGIAVFFLDLDHFKQVNDTFGHAIGDKLLQQVGDRLKQALRPYDTVARFGGDEFALLIDGIKTSHDCASIAQKIIELFDIPYHISGKQINMSVSIGIATCMSNESVSREALMKHADEAMYVAKTIPRSEYRFYI